MKYKNESTDSISVSDKAQVLIEALPWLKKFNNQIIVIKFGGNAMVSEELSRAFAEDIVFLRMVGLKPVVVHGGGPQITNMLHRLNISSEFKAGYRVTTPEIMQVVRMVLTGQINPSLVSLINEHTPLAVGVSGEDAILFEAKKMYGNEDGKKVDIGLVGEIVKVNSQAVLAQLDDGLIPVVSSIAPDTDNPGSVLNINADAAAAAIASELKAAKLVILTDVAGLYSNWPNTDSLLSVISISELKELLPKLETGMIPKMQACLDAVSKGVEKAAIIDGRNPHSILLEVFTSDGVGTEVVPG